MKRANLLSSLSNTKWGIPPQLFKILISSTVHAPDYAVAAWQNLPIPKFFAEKLRLIDNICKTRALGALRNSPSVVLRHDLDMKAVAIRLSARIANTIAISAAKPPSHPLFSFYQHARKTTPTTHKGPLPAYFQSPLATAFKAFAGIQQPDSTIPLQPTPNFSTLIMPDKDKALKSIEALRPSDLHTIIYSEGSRVEGKNTASAAWCENNQHNSTHKLGRAHDYGILEAEYIGFILSLKIIKYSCQRQTRHMTIVLDNQGVFKDMGTKKTSSRDLEHKLEAIQLINDVESIAPHVKITLRWCPGRKGIPGNEKEDSLANKAAKKPLPSSHADKPTYASFCAAIKTWSERSAIESYTTHDIKRLGHGPHPKQHIAALNNLKNKHSVSSITQLRTGHAPLFQYLARRNLRSDPTCKCGLDQENVEHFLLSCPIHVDPRQDLRNELDKLEVPFSRKALHYPAALESIANFTSSTWRP